jgi:hypothetical protein
MGGTPVFDGCLSHGKRRTASSPGTREFGWDSIFYEVVMGDGVPVVYATPIYFDMHGVIAQMLGLVLIGGGLRVFTLTTFASSRV